MIALIVFGVIALYFAVLIGCTVAGYKIAARRGLSRGKRWLGAVIGFGVIFLPVFWDTIPTLWLHRHYCQTKGGLTVYKTLDQWKKENPRVAETLTSEELSPQIVLPGVEQAYQLNQRFRWEIRTGTRSFGIRMRDERITDAKNDEVQVQFVDFGTGIPNVVESGFNSFRDLKIWLDRNTCPAISHDPANQAFGQLKTAFKHLGDKK